MHFIAWMCHNLFSLSPVDGHLDFSPVFAITRKVAMYIYVQILLEYSFYSSRIITQEYDFWEMWLLYIYFYEKPQKCFQVYLYHFTFWPAMCESFNFFTSLPELGVATIFILDILIKFIVKSLWGFNLYSLMMNCVQHLFMCLFVIYTDLLQQNIWSCILPFW